MFCSNYHIGNDMLSSKKDMFVLINWVCSVVVLFTLPHLFSQPFAATGNEECVMAEGANATDDALTCGRKDNNFGSLLGFTSVSYLVGYFGLLLAMKDQDRRARSLNSTGEFNVLCTFYLLDFTLVSFVNIFLEFLFRPTQVLGNSLFHPCSTLEQPHF